MQNSKDKLVTDALQRLAAQPLIYRLPQAEQLWSRVQFRRRYQARDDYGNTISTASTAAVAVYMLAFLLWNAQLRLLDLGIAMGLILVVTAAAALCLRIARVIRS